MPELTEKINRLTKIQDRLQLEWNLTSEKLEKLRAAVAIESGVSIKFQLEHEIKNEEAQNRELEQKLDEIERALTSGSISPYLLELFPEINVDDTNPYQGLSAFTPETAKFFFGRKSEINKLEEKVEDTNFVPVIGASGCGKSSLIRAGLIPRLLELDWQLLGAMKPGENPLAALKSTVGALFGQERVEIDRLLEEQGLGAIASRLPGDKRFLLVVDQFEEVFTLCHDRQQQQQFIDCLTTVRQSENRRLVVVTTMRADFVEPWLRSGVLTEAIQDDALFLGTLAGENLEAAIVQPAMIQGYHLESGLLDSILRDVEAEDNCLPLLEFALTELWEKRDRSNYQLTVTEYKALGRLLGALDRHAEEIYRDLEPRGQGEWVRRVMLQLVRTGEGIKDTRQRRSQAELLGMGADAATQGKIEKTIDKLVNGRLLTIDRVNDENIIDLSHEALMGGWQRFAKWRESDRDVRRLVDKIEQERRDKRLLEGRLLGDAKRLMKDRSEFLVGEVRSFVEKSLQHQKWKRVRSAGWLIIPALMLGIPAEIYWRDQIVRQSYRGIETAKGTQEERVAVFNLAGGCWAEGKNDWRTDVSGSYAWLPEYFRERTFGNCQSLARVNLSGANLIGADLRRTDLSSANLSSANLSSASLSDADLIDANLSGADLKAAHLSNTDLTRANLRDADLKSADFIGANLRDANLSGADLYSANLRDTDLSDAKLIRSNLIDADLRDANLRDADLRDANLLGADLRGTRLINTDLSGAILRSANLWGTNLSFADLSNVKLECFGKSPCIDMKNIEWNKDTNWKGIKGWENVKNIPPELKKQLNLP